MDDRRLARGHRFLQGRGFSLNLDDAVVVGQKGEQAVLIPFTDRGGSHEAYLLYKRKGSKQRVTMFVLHLGLRQAYDTQEPNMEASYSEGAYDALWVEEAYVVYDYEEIDYSDYGPIVYNDESGVIASSIGQALEEASRIVKCTGAGCAGVVVRCLLAGPGVLKCMMAGCTGVGVACIIGALLL